MAELCKSWRWPRQPRFLAGRLLTCALSVSSSNPQRFPYLEVPLEPLIGASACLGELKPKEREKTPKISKSSSMEHLLCAKKCAISLMCTVSSDLLNNSENGFSFLLQLRKQVHKIITSHREGHMHSLAACSRARAPHQHAMHFLFTFEGSF